MSKKKILASLIYNDKLDWFIDNLVNRYGLNRENIFIYNIIGESKKLVTYIVDITAVDIKSIKPNVLTIHKRGETYYTINALNKLIEENNLDLIGNINYKEYTIDWSKYKNKLLLINNGDLKISDINRFLPNF
jgi:hypothetical protein